MDPDSDQNYHLSHSEMQNDPNEPWSYLPDEVRNTYKQFANLYFQTVHVQNPRLDKEIWMRFAKEVFMRLKDEKASAELSEKSASKKRPSTSPNEKCKKRTKLDPIGSLEGPSIHPNECFDTAFPDCPCKEAAKEALVWVVLASGAILAPDSVLAIDLIIKTRKSLTRSLFCTGEITFMVLVYINIFYLTLMDFRLSVMFAKIGLDIFNTLPSVCAGTKMSRDIFCLLFCLPPTPTSTKAIRVEAEEIKTYLYWAYSDLNVILTDHNGNLPSSMLFLTRGAEKLAAEAQGLLSHVERCGGSISNEMFSTIERDLGLSRSLSERWNCFGDLNLLNMTIVDMLSCVGIFYLWERGRKSGGISNLENVVTPKEEQQTHNSSEAAQEMYLNERRQLKEIEPSMSTFIAKSLPQNSKSFSLVTSMTSLSIAEDEKVPPSPLLELTLPELLATGKNLAKETIQNLAATPWRKFPRSSVTPFLINFISVLVAWELWEELEIYQSVLTEASSIYIGLRGPCKWISDILELVERFQQEEAPGTRPELRVGRISTATYLSGPAPEELWTLLHQKMNQMKSKKNPLENLGEFLSRKDIDLKETLESLEEEGGSELF